MNERINSWQNARVGFREILILVQMSSGKWSESWMRQQYVGKPQGLWIGS